MFVGCWIRKLEILQNICYNQQKCKEEVIMLAIKIDNPEIESRFRKLAKKNKKAIHELASDALKLYLDVYKNDELVYAKKDPLKNIHKVDFQDDGEDLSNVELYSRTKDSAKYIHKLRRKIK